METVKKSITDFVNVIRQKNGRIRIKYPRNKEKFIYMALKEFGYRFSKLQGKEVYYRRNNHELTITTFYQMKDDFAEYLKSLDPSMVGGKAIFDRVISEFYRQNPIRQNPLLKEYYIEDSLSQRDEEILIPQIPKTKDWNARKSYWDWRSYTQKEIL